MGQQNDYLKSEKCDRPHTEFELYMSRWSLDTHFTVAIAEALLVSTVGTLDDLGGVIVHALQLARPPHADQGLEPDMLAYICIYIYRKHIMG